MPIEITGPAPTLWSRLHASLMPDYNRKATYYWWTVVVLGAAALVHSALTIASLRGMAQIEVAVGIAIAILAGIFPVRIPRSTNSFAAGETFIFLLLLLQGPAAATLAAGGEGLVGALRTSNRWTSRIATPAMAAVAMFSASTLFETLQSWMGPREMINAGLIIVMTMGFSLVYFLFNTLLVTAVPRLKRNERFQVTDLLGVFGWVGIAFAGSAAVAALLYLTFQASGIGVLMAMLPVMAMLLVTLHYFFRQQEASEAMREVSAKALEREAQAAIRHMEALEASERRFHSAFTHASIGMALLSFEGRILQANEALRNLLGKDETTLREHSFQEFVDAADLEAMNAELARVNDAGFETFSLELRCIRSNGEKAWISAHCSFFAEPETSAPCLILQAEDISARRVAEVSLKELAYQDSLTGLPNRRRFHEFLTEAVERSHANAQQQFAVMFLDFDRFKLINDSLGHSVGDDFLIQAARRIQEQIRPQDVLARLGGDEFAVLVRGMDEQHDAITLAERMIVALQVPFFAAGTQLNVSASIGITTSALKYTKAEDVLRDADTAMYKSKACGKACYSIYDTSLHVEVAQRLRLEGDLRQAIDNGTLWVAFQPLYEMANGQLTGFEALARWTHPELGVIPPDLFIPIAEDSGLIIPLTDFVLRSACQQLKQWQLRDPSFAALTMNVNISAKDIARPGLVARVTQELVRAQLLPQHLTIELTENILMEQLETAFPLLEQLRELGIGLSIDDFGTGYSSLAHLSSLPINSVKVDRSFISDLRSGSNESTVVSAIVNLGNSLGKKVIAEGIETASQFFQLRAMGCETGQGFHLSRALAPEFIDMLLTDALNSARLVSTGKRSRADMLKEGGLLSGVHVSSTGPLVLNRAQGRRLQ